MHLNYDVVLMLHRRDSDSITMLFTRNPTIIATHLRFGNHQTKTEDRILMQFQCFNFSRMSVRDDAF